VIRAGRTPRPFPQKKSDRAALLVCLGYGCASYGSHLGDAGLLDKAIQMYRVALKLRPLDHPAYKYVLLDFGRVLECQYRISDDLNFLTQAISVYRKVVEISSPDDDHYGPCLADLGGTLVRLSEQNGNIGSLEEAIPLLRKVVKVCTPEHEAYATSLGRVAWALLLRGEKSSNVDSLAEAIGLFRKALEVSPQGHPSRAPMQRDLDKVFRMHKEATNDVRDPLPTGEERDAASS
jgi:tetratricopeptide (TPR) repeat protein